MTPSTRLDIAREVRGEAEILRAQGELDLTTTEDLGRALEATTKPLVVLDLGMLVFIDSAGLRAIDLGHRLLDDSGRSLRIVAPPDSRAAWTFRVAGTDDRVLASVDDAVSEDPA
jgi:anti-anti-sigma factor